MVGRQADVAIEEIREEVVDDLHHCPSKCSNYSVNGINGSHLGLTTHEALAGCANALPGLGDIDQDFCCALFQSLLYRFSAQLRKFGLSWFSTAARVGTPARESSGRIVVPHLETLCFPTAMVKMFDKPVVVNVFANVIMPQTRIRSEVIPFDNSLVASFLDLRDSLSLDAAKSGIQRGVDDGPIPCKTSNNSDICQAKPSTEDDVEYSVTELFTR
ncbi:hypothetical protein V3C99_004613 [Haemonchus contortus]